MLSKSWDGLVMRRPSVGEGVSCFLANDPIYMLASQVVLFFEGTSR